MKLWFFSLILVIIIYFITPPGQYPNRLEVIPSQVDNSYYDSEEYSTTWNDPNSWASGLHIINPTRRDYILKTFNEYKISKNSKILDLGCGGGLLTIEMAKSGFKNIKGVDISPNSVIEATKFSKYSSLNIEFKTGSVYQIPEENNTFDVVIVADVLEHLNDLQLGMKEIDRVLKKGGLVFFETIDRNIYSNLFVKVLGETFGVIPKNTHDYRLFIKPTELEDLFSKFNFTLVEFYGYKFEFGLSDKYIPMIKYASLLSKGVVNDLYIGHGIKMI
eukprot:gene8505-329_t